MEMLVMNMAILHYRIGEVLEFFKEKTGPAKDAFRFVHALPFVSFRPFHLSNIAYLYTCMTQS